MSGLYKVPLIAQAMADATQYDIFTISNHAARPTVLKGLKLFQTSEFGDAQEEILALILKTGLDAVGSGGTAVTPVNTDRDGGAAGFTARVMDQPKATGASPVSVDPIGWNTRVDKDDILPEEWQILMPAGLIWTIELVTNPAGAKTVYGSLLVQEIG